MRERIIGHNILVKIVVYLQQIWKMIQTIQEVVQNGEQNAVTYWLRMKCISDVFLTVKATALRPKNIEL